MQHTNSILNMDEFRNVHRFLLLPFFVAEIFMETSGALMDDWWESAVTEFEGRFRRTATTSRGIVLRVRRDVGRHGEGFGVGVGRGGQQVSGEQRVCCDLLVMVRIAD